MLAPMAEAAALQRWWLTLPESQQLLGVNRQLRLATLADLPALASLERYCFSPWLAFGHRRWRYLLRRPQVQVWLLLQGEQLLAYLCLVPHKGWKSLAISALAVHWQVRGQGVARQLLRLVEPRARQLGLHSLRLEVDCDNESALRLYWHQGFVEQRALPHYYGLGRPGLLLSRRLEPSPGEATYL